MNYDELDQKRSRVKAEVVVAGEVGNQTTKDMKIGDIARLRSGKYKMYSGEIILRTFTGYVSLSNPALTWDISASMDCVIFPPDADITLERKEQ